MIQQNTNRPKISHWTRAHARYGGPRALAAAVLGVLIVSSAPALASEASNTPAPNLASRACVQGDQARARSDFPSAINHYTTCLKTANLTSEQRAIVLTNRGNVYFRMGEQESARDDFDRAIELKPDAAVAHYNRGLSSFVMGRYEDAVADSSKAIRIDPTMATAYYNRGAAYANMGNYEKAIVDLTEAIRLRPTWALAYSARGDVYLRFGDAENGARDHAEAARLDPSFAIQPAR